MSDTHKKTGLGFLRRERVSRRGFALRMRFFLEIDLNESLLVKSNVGHAKISSSVAVFSQDFFVNDFRFKSFVLLPSR